jgi:hypothetical protein
MSTVNRTRDGLRADIGSSWARDRQPLIIKAARGMFAQAGRHQLDTEEIAAVGLIGSGSARRRTCLGESNGRP